MTKSELRKQIIRKRKFLSNEEIEEKSRVITDKIRKQKEFTEAKTVLIYLPILGEVSPLGLMNNEKTFLVPYISDDTMYATKYNKGDCLQQGKMSTVEPKNAKPFDKNKIDLIIFPGTVFGRNKGRMGFGKGFYDSFSKDVLAKKIGICYDFQLFDSVEMLSHDVFMDKVITEREVIF